MSDPTIPTQWVTILIRYVQAFAVAAGLLAAAPALASDLIVDVAAPASDAASRGYATFFAGATRSSATFEVWDTDSDVFFGFGGDLEDGYIVGAAIGTELLPHLRGEVEFSVVKTDLGSMGSTDIDNTGYNLLGNLWYDVDTGTSFTPYIGGGAGWAYDVMSDGTTDEWISGLTYQLGAGVRFAATENIGFDLGYRYRVRSHADISGFTPDPDTDVKISATTHIVQAGVTFGF
jgi:opacity protein-like surface antigen